MGLLLVLSLLAWPSGSAAQGTVDGTARDGNGVMARTFGTAATVSHTLDAFAFTGSAADSSSYQDNGTSRFCGGSCAFKAGLLLPAGAVVTAIELEGCDTNTLGAVRASLVKFGPLESGSDTLATVSTGIAETPGCKVFPVALGTPHTIDNLNNTYRVIVAMQVDPTAGGPAARFQSVRVSYHLQVSPPPATATFGDVPTNHPLFQFVEAMVAAGITSGCQASPPLYCPDNPVTRAQIAKFFSLALGLQWAP